MSTFAGTPMHAQAMSHLQRGDWRAAMAVCRPVLDNNKKDTGALTVMALAEAARGNHDEAVRLFEKCVTLEPAMFEHHVNLGQEFLRFGRFKQGIARLERAHRMRPRDTRGIGALADAYDKGGDPKRAMEILAPLAQGEAPEVGIVGVYAKILLDSGDAQKAADLMLRQPPAPGYPSNWFFTLGRALEKLGRFDEAFAAYSEGNRRQSQLSPFNLNGFVARQSGLMHAMTRASLANVPRAADRSVTPIIIAGRPRSGTTLVEKILDAHPRITGIGESRVLFHVVVEMPGLIGAPIPFPANLPRLTQQHIDHLAGRYREHVRQVAGKASMVADKSLNNLEALGLIQLLLPNARVVCCQRDPLDLCFSCFTEDLRTHSYTTDLRALGVTQIWADRLMRHWKENLDLPFLDVSYEALVNDQEAQTRRLIEFCGVPWDDRCLRHHEAASGSGPRDLASAPTLSHNQARQAVYKSAVGRAAKFEKHLAPLHQGFAEGREMVAKAFP